MAATAFLFVLALPLGERHYLAWFALAPLIAATRERTFLVGFLGALGSMLLSAVISSSGALYRHHHADGTDAWVITGFMQYGFTFALLVGIASEKGASRWPAWWFACLGVLLEAVQLWVLPAHFALSQYRHLLLLQVASVGGIWAISFLLFWVNFAISRLQIRNAVLWSGVAILLAVITQPLTRTASGVERRYSAVQVEEGDEELVVRLHHEASKLKLTFAVWPEFGGLTFVSRNDTHRLRDISRDSAPFVTSFRDDYSPLPHNVASLFANGFEQGKYAKRKLFGSETKMHMPGDRPASASLGGMAVGLNICFDSCYPFIIRETVKQPNVQAVALPTIDPDSRNDFIAAAHAAFTPFRAAETGVPIVRADGHAFSMIVDGRGVIVAELKRGNHTLTASASTLQNRPLAFRFGDWFLWASGIGLVTGWILDLRRRRAKRDR